MSFFFDNCISPKLARALVALGEEVHHLQEEFPAGTTDEIWVPGIAQRGYHVVTTDLRIFKRPQQRQILIDARLACFFLPKNFPQLEKWEQASKLMKYWPAIVQQASQSRPGDFFSVQMNGHIEPLHAD